MVDDAVITVSSPGSLMLLGEHAVLHGHRALVCAINRRITVRLTPLGEKRLKIHSCLGEYDHPLYDLPDDPSFRFVLQAVRQHVGQLPAGLRLRIDSDFSADIGFGSSAAVTVAVHGAVLHWLLGKPPPHRALFDRALQTVHAVQGRGSGADLAASVFGGAVCYANTPSFEPVSISLPLTAVYSGYKTPTPEVISRVEQLRAEHPDRFEMIYTEMDTLAADAVKCLRQRDLLGFGMLVDRNHQLMEDIGVNTPQLQEIVEALRSCDGIFGAKISGSGLGDCAVGIGHADLKTLDYPVYHLEVSSNGCVYHE